MALKVSSRGQVPPFMVMDVLRAANEREAAGHDVVHLEVGQPSTSAPAGVIEAAKQALDADRLGYTDAFGIPPLREKIAAHYAETYDVTVATERIVVTTGSSGGFVISFLGAFDEGDRVALAEPGYPAYRNILVALGIEPVTLPVGADEHFQPTPDLLEAAIREGGDLDGLIIASPANPTGSMLSHDRLKALADYCDAKGIRLISDEIYHGIVYGEAASSALQFTENAVVINSFSKYFSMTGWRIGWSILPDDMVRAVDCLKQNLFISAPTLSQFAAAAAFECREELDANVARYRANRDLLLNRLPEAGLETFAPADGAFYLFANVSHLTNDSEEFCRRMLNEAGVATAPGMDFDRDRGPAWLRMSFAGSEAEMAEACDRLKSWLD